MKEIKLNKKKLITVLAIIIAIIVAIIVIVKIVNKGPEVPETPEVPQIIALPQTTYSDMEVRNIEMEYLKDNNETMITMEIHNTTQNKVEKEKLEVIWVGPNDELLGTVPTSIKKLDVGEQYDISVILKGDLTATKQIKLKKK